jgi:hypothetical protein
MICEEYHYMKDGIHHQVVTKFLKGTSQPVQQQHLVAQNPSPPQKGNASHSHHGDASVNVYAIIIVLFISIDNSIIRTRSLRNTHSQETQHLS